MDQFSPKELMELKQGFKMFATERSGRERMKVTTLGEAMRSFGANPLNAQLEAYLEEFEEQEKGELDFPDFLTKMAQQKKAVTKNGGEDYELGQAFIVFNRSKSGYVSAAEIKAFFATIKLEASDAEVNGWITEFGKEAPSKGLNKDEFSNMMLWSPPDE